ncbi:MAG: hypothetical protein HGA45_21855 [Chloroflexales bacterium]|nr:hypothetical protein [Chloroflexales bacterium]
MDATALYLVATRSAAQYARLGGQGSAAVWFFYLLTAALNSLFVLSYTPGLPRAVQAITPTLSLVGAVLLGLLVPISIAALEHARQVADVARLSLLVEVETLRGLVARGAEPPEPPATDAPAIAADDRAAAANIVAISRTYRCKYCDATELSASELMTHGRRHARYGTCATPTGGGEEGEPRPS